MKRFTLLALLLISAFVFKAVAQDTIAREQISSLNDQVSGLTERLATAESDLSKLTKIKVSGYMQAQYQHFESLSAQPDNYFSLRRARVKFTYQASDGVKFVFTPELLPGSASLKDAYVVLNDRWLNAFSLWAGKFNRPNYEVEYSSSNREVAERSLIIRTLYPSERAVGAKLEYNPENVPFHLQVALLNGADVLTINNNAGVNLNANENRDFDNFKDIMARATFNLKLGNFGGLDFGGHGYYGALKSNAKQTLASDYTTLETINVGDPIRRAWAGAEFQLYADVLGGMSVKGEYLQGKNATVGYSEVAAIATAAAVPGLANFQNNFSGYYVYFIKNLGKKNQFAFRYDYYDPNTDIKGKEIAITKFTSPDETTLRSRTSGKSDLATNTFSLALNHFYDNNIRITLNYDIVQNEKVSAPDLVTEDYKKADGTTVAKGLDYSKVVNNNVLTLRLQAKF